MPQDCCAQNQGKDSRTWNKGNTEKGTNDVQNPQTMLTLSSVFKTAWHPQHFPKAITNYALNLPGLKVWEQPSCDLSVQEHYNNRSTIRTNVWGHHLISKQSHLFSKLRPTLVWVGEEGEWVEAATRDTLQWYLQNSDGFWLKSVRKCHWSQKKKKNVIKICKRKKWLLEGLSPDTRVDSILSVDLTNNF